MFLYETTVQPDWIDYNGHMRDAFYGLVFSFAVDGVQDAVGLDEAYRTATNCTIYLLEHHCFYLSEVKLGAPLRVESRVIGCDAKRFHLHQTMLSEGRVSSVCEFMELHVSQDGTPHAAEMPDAIQARLRDALLSDAEIEALPHRSRPIGLRKR